MRRVWYGAWQQPRKPPLHRPSRVGRAGRTWLRGFPDRQTHLVRGSRWLFVGFPTLPDLALAFALALSLAIIVSFSLLRCNLQEPPLSPGKYNSSGHPPLPEPLRVLDKFSLASRAHRVRLRWKAFLPPKREAAHPAHQPTAMVGGQSRSRAQGGSSSSNTDRVTSPRSGSARVQAGAATSACDSESLPASTAARSASQTPPRRAPLPRTLLPAASTKTTPSAATAARSASQTPPSLAPLPRTLLPPTSTTTTPSAAPVDARGLTWFSDTTFELRQPYKRTGSTYTFITLLLDHSPATLVKVTHLLGIYSDRWNHYRRMHTAQRRSTPDDDSDPDPDSITAAAAQQYRNVMQHLQVLWDLRGNRERWLRKLACILAPESQRTFVFRQVRTWEGEQDEGIWVEVEREGRSAGGGAGAGRAGGHCR
ncbi:hypothetical protein GJ744_010093 [Endocarpon pusillum]|uniref:Uncharacterized protein n=1 Tax=Endocarpon pusillum TaxID=364733 RepID=A0A8H7E3A1_9EURO|nr:hypothetical protein GJ744_010093 [Endocarpon pusillum]